MKFWFIFSSNLRRNPTRTWLTALCLVIAFLLFGLLQPIANVFTNGPDYATIGRLVVTPKHSTSDMLPVSYFDQIQQLDDVESVTHMTWFGGTYKDAANFFPQFAVTQKEMFAVMPEVKLASHEQAAFVNNRRGAIIGKETADRFAFEVGDRIILTPNIWHNRDDIPWEFDLVGIYTSGDESVINEQGFYFGYDYFDEYRAFANGTVGSYLVKVNNPQSIANIANKIDTLFANSGAETRTQTDREYALSFAKQMGNVGLIVNAILFSVFFTIILLTANILSQTIRERIPEFAVMRVFGFQAKTIMRLVLTESMLLVTLGALLGLVSAELVLQQATQVIPQLKQLGVINVPLDVFASGLAIALTLGLFVGLAPAINASRTSIVEALRV